MNQQNQSNTSKPQTTSSTSQSGQSSQAKASAPTGSSQAGGMNMDSQSKSPVKTEQSAGSSSKESSREMTSTQGQKHPQQNAILEPLAKFEEAITGFAGTLGETRQNIETVVDLTLRSKDELLHIKEAFMPYLTDARGVTQKVASRVKATPTPVIWTVAGLIGSFLVWSLYSGKTTHVAKSKAALH